jgi:hypothetical protein
LSVLELSNPAMTDPAPVDPPPVGPEPADAAPAGSEPTDVESAGPASAEPGSDGSRVDDAVRGGSGTGGAETGDVALLHPEAAAPRRPPGPVRELPAVQARRLALEAWREARLSSPSGRAHFLSTVDSWLERGWSVAYYGTGARVMLYSFGAPGAWLPGSPPPHRLPLPRGVGRLAGVYTGGPLFPGDKGDYLAADAFAEA